MANKITKQPEIRFKEFNNDWEQRKLKDVSERVRGNDGRMDLPTLTISAGSGWLDQRERFSGNIAGKEQKNYTLLSKGEISYNHGNSKLAKYGAVFVLRTFEEALVPRVYHSFKTNEKASADFIEYMFATKIPDRELGKLISSGARMDGLLNINYDDFMGIKINIPSIEEQERISAFLRQLDDTIALQNCKLEEMQLYKKAMLQKMFPKNGEKAPEIRFDGYNDDWEQRKLKDVTNHRGGTAIEKYFSDEGKYKVISIGSYGLDS
ncbi:restriction endonuclease subunit S, partial [Vagococcus fluvialis]|uniref:restriction endonuclease subunit S n=1 Tax=Vagococcus fluvialis TaxID=2738 RepID=UPI003B5BF16A